MTNKILFYRYKLTNKILNFGFKLTNKIEIVLLY